MTYSRKCYHSDNVCELPNKLSVGKLHQQFTMTKGAWLENTVSGYL